MDLYGMDAGGRGDDGYDEVTITWDGALESVTYWPHEAHRNFAMWDNQRNNFDAWIEQLERDAGDSEVEVYILSHAHAPIAGDNECACAQFATDHRPDYAFNAS